MNCICRVCLLLFLSESERIAHTETSHSNYLCIRPTLRKGFDQKTSSEWHHHEWALLTVILIDIIQMLITARSPFFQNILAVSDVANCSEFVHKKVNFQGRWVSGYFCRSNDVSQWFFGFCFFFLVWICATTCKRKSIILMTTFLWARLKADRAGMGQRTSQMSAVTCRDWFSTCVVFLHWLLVSVFSVMQTGKENENTRDRDWQSFYWNKIIATQMAGVCQDPQILFVDNNVINNKNTLIWKSLLLTYLIISRKDYIGFTNKQILTKENGCSQQKHVLYWWSFSPRSSQHVCFWQTLSVFR